MSNVINLQHKRAKREEQQRREREEAFDRELRRRLALFYAGQTTPVEPIPDNPYI